MEKDGNAERGISNNQTCKGNGKQNQKFWPTNKKRTVTNLAAMVHTANILPIYVASMHQSCTYMYGKTACNHSFWDPISLSLYLSIIPSWLLHRSSASSSWWTFRPRQKIFSPPPPPPKKSPIRRRHPPDPSAPPRETPPPVGFSIKNLPPPPPGALGLPLPRPRAEKNKKYPKRPPSHYSLVLLVA